MKKLWSILLATSLFLIAFAGCSSPNAPAPSGSPQGGKLSVYASFYPMADFAAKIGGDKIDVVNMVPSGMEPHDWEPTASDIAGLEQADVFIYNGAGMEHWAQDVLASLQNKSLLAVEASKGVSLLEGHDHHEGEEEEAEGEDHDEEEGQYDPHVWLSPKNAKAEMEAIKNAFVQADPDNKAYYEENYGKYAAECDALDKEYSDALAPFSGKDIIVAHQAFGYLCAAYNLNQVPIEGLSPDSEPDPARVAEIIEFAKAHEVKVIFFEELVSPKVAETIASAIDAKTDVLNPLEGLSDEQRAAGDDYFSVMRGNLVAIIAALQ